MASEQSIYQWFLRSARRYPGQPAIIVGGAEFNYRQLHLAAIRAARLMLRAGDGRPKRVGVVVGRNLGTFAGYLGAQRLAAAVVPLNSDFPVARNVAAVQAADLDVLVTPHESRAIGEALAAASGARSVVLPENEPLVGPLAAEPVDHLPYPAMPDDLAYILFTSGSTGAPKGVPIRHASVSAYVEYNVDLYEVGPTSRLALTSDLTFDLSGFALFLAWAGASAIVIPEKPQLLEPAQFVDDYGITHWLSVPSVVSLARQLETLPPDSMPTLRWSLFIGEPLTIDQALAWYEAAPYSTVENLYGPTEVTISCTSYRLPADPASWPSVNGTVPIGAPYPVVECLVVDESGRLSDEGELLLRGVQRFDGYLNPALNAGRFAFWDGATAQPYDGSTELTAEHWYRSGDRVRYQHGELFHLGRVDNQLKVRGYRIEPGDIEAVLRTHPAVNDAVVVPTGNSADELELAAMYTGRPAGSNELTEYLAERLPAHMVPERFTWLSAFPLNVNGKVDRGRLIADATADATAA